MADTDLFLVGRVARAHGNKGQVIVNPETDFPEARFQAGQTLLVGPEGYVEPKRIRDVRFHQGRPIVALDGIDTMNDAEGLAGADLWMRADALPALPEGTYYRHDLVGCEVIDATGRAIGRVTSVEGPLDRSRIVVAGERGEILIPLVADICVEVDTGAKRIVVNPPEGLLDLNAAADSAAADGRG
jgi:16S rRNA processing protein RimM